MKWSEVEIKDLNDKVHTGMMALRFVETNCKPFANSIKDDLIEVNTYSPSASTDDKEVRSVLFSKLKGKAKSVRFLKGDTTPRELLPLARALPNIVNFNPPKLKVEFIYKLDPLKNDPPKLFKELPFKVTSSLGPSMDSQDGEADFKVVAPGKHKLTIAFCDPSQDKFEFRDSTAKTPGQIEREADLDPGDDYTVTVEIVPLYTKVIFIGHCLVTIAKQIYHDNTKEWEARYTGKTPEIQDIEARVKFLGDVIKKAAGIVGDKQEELKVFVAPECFFLGPNGAYSIDALSSLVEKLQDLVKDPQWENWLFAFGTVNAAYEEEGNFLELLNHTPVIRGGFKSKDKAPDYTKLIQKTFYSAEMPVESELKNPTDEQFYGELFRKDMSPTEYEYIFGRQVQELLEVTWDMEQEEWVSNVWESMKKDFWESDFGTEKKGSRPGETLIGGKTVDAVCLENNWKAGEWAELRNKAIEQLKTRGMTCVVRDVRDNKDTKWGANRFKEVLLWYVNSKTDKVPKNVLIPKTSNTFSPENFTFYCARKPGPLIKEDALPKKFNISFGLEICADHSQGRLKGSRSDAANQLEELAVPIQDNLKLLREEKNGTVGKPPIDKKIREAAEGKEALEKVVEFLKQSNIEEAQKTFKAVFQEALKPKQSDVSLTEAENLLKEGEELLKEKTELLAALQLRKPKLEEEFKKANEEMTKIQLQRTALAKQKELDIQLVPSAGMSVAPMNVATKPGGYFFNCNGWNPSSGQVQDLVKRNAKIVKIEKPNYPVSAGQNPLYYHSELLKTPMKSVQPSVTDLTDDVSEIFAEGPGQLHIYPPQDLEK